MANTIPQHGTSQPGQPQQQGGVAQQPQGQLGGFQSGQAQGTSSPSQGASGLVDKLAQTADSTAHKAIERVQETRERALSGIERQQAQLRDRIRDVSGALRSSGHKLSDNEMVASLLDTASDKVDRLASYVDTASARGLAADVHNFARQRPAWFFGGAFLAGLALGRFAKSSARAASEGSSQDLSSAARGRHAERATGAQGSGYGASSLGSQATGRDQATTGSTSGASGASSGSTASSRTTGSQQSGAASRGGATGPQSGSTPGGSGSPSGYSSATSPQSGSTPGGSGSPSGYSSATSPSGSTPAGSAGPTGSSPASPSGSTTRAPGNGGAGQS